MNAWLWASVFHARDRPVTEALDYHSATAVQFAAAVSAAVRVFELSPTRRFAPPPYISVAHNRQTDETNRQTDRQMEISAACIVAEFRGVSVCCAAAPLAEEPSQLYLLRHII